MKRILLFFAVNLLVVLTVSLLLNVLGVRPYLSARGLDYGALLIFCAAFGFAGSFISLALSRWTAKTMMGVELIDPSRPGSDGEGLLVEKIRALSSQAGLGALPEIGIYSSPEVNAFATGPTSSRALVAVSTGLLERMDDDAVEGVLAHELSHVANGDMVTMTLLQGVANTFVMFFARVIAFAIDQSLRSRDSEERGRGGLGPFAHYLVVMLLESVLMLLASTLIYAFSRRREYRADAGGARLAGRGKMIHALESLKDYQGSLDTRQAALAAMKINGKGRGLVGMLFSSHPSLDDRIRRLQEAA